MRMFYDINDDLIHILFPRSATAYIATAASFRDNRCWSLVVGVNVGFIIYSTSGGGRRRDLPKFSPSLSECRGGN